MSINLGNDAIDLIKKLPKQASETLRDALREAAGRAVHVGINSAPELRVDHTAYARAVTDVYLAFEAAATGKRPNQLDKPITDGLKALS